MSVSSLSLQDATRLGESLDAGDVSRAWHCGGPIPNRGLVLGRGSELFRVVRLGGSEGTR